MESPKERYALELFRESRLACDGCKSFTDFGESCWFFWKNKNVCSQRR